MKTKIIYISGNELFDMADIRAAFDEVRNALSLGSDTILFGVPVDSDDAMESPKMVQSISKTVEPIPEPIIQEKEEPIVLHDEIPEPTPTKPKVVPIFDSIAPQSDEHDSVEPTPTVVPISSVLAGIKPVELKESEPVDDVVDVADAEQNEPMSDDVVIDEIETVSETVSVADMIADEAPEIEHEKTLEELLESMAPLGEDAEKIDEPIATPEPLQSVAPSEEKPKEDDTDITLEKLATEFVANQDKITTSPKPSTRGKIGKLKNILPFKKAKHDDSGLMGDLFGWAGVAANDEDFTIPGFFK